MKIFLEKTSIDNGVAALRNLIRLLKVKVSAKAFENVKNHPSYPGIEALSEGLSEWNIQNMTVRLNSVQLSEIPYPAIAHLFKNNGHFVVLQKMENGQIEYVDSQVGFISESIIEFEKKWTGIVLLVETTNESGEPRYKENRKSEVLKKIRQSGFFALSALLMIWMFILNPIFTIPLVVNIFGTAFCTILLMQTVGQHSLVADAVCKPNSKTDCGKVINSRAAKIYGDISLSEVGLLFFSGALFTNMLSIVGKLVPFNTLLFSLIVISFPFTLLSIYYQWRVVKTWCPLCLSVVLMLWIETIYYTVNLNSIYSSQAHFNVTMIGFSAPLLFWLAVRPSVLKSQKIPSLEKSLYRFKKNQKIFDGLMLQSPVSDMTLYEHDLIIGNAESKDVITLVTNPNCAPCISAHYHIENWLSQFKGKLRAVIRFSVNSKDESSEANIVARILISLSLANDEEKLKQALTKWYSPHRPSVKNWLSSFQHIIHPNAEEYLLKHEEWCNKNKITMTPTIFFNGKQIPEEYSMQDLEYFLRKKLTETI